MKRMLDHLGFESALTATGLPLPGSNRCYRPEQLITQFMLSVWCGANCFEDGEVTRHDPVLKRLFGLRKTLESLIAECASGWRPRSCPIIASLSAAT